MLKKSVNKTEGPVNARYRKKQLIRSDRYREQRDLLWALLDDEKVYSITETDEIINQFMKGKVKVC